jgi:hypothetical protein
MEDGLSPFEKEKVHEQILHFCNKWVLKGGGAVKRVNSIEEQSNIDDLIREVILEARSLVKSLSRPQR